MLTEAVLTMVFLGHGTAAVCLPFVAWQESLFSPMLRSEG